MSKKINKSVPNLRFPEFGGDWEDKTLAKVSNVQTGPFGSQLKNEQYITGGTPVVTVEHIKDFWINNFDYPSVTDEDRKRLKKYSLKSGDIVFSRVGSVDLSACVEDYQEGWLFSSRMLRVRPNQQLKPKFIAYFLQQNKIRRYIIRISVGSTMPSLNTEILQNLLITYCSLAEQEKIASFLGVIDKRLTQLRREHELLQTYKRGVMQKIFSQEIRFKGAVGEAFPDWEERKLGEIAKRQVKKNLDESITRVLTNSAVQGVVAQQDYFDKDIANANNLAGYYIIEKSDYVYNPRISVNAPVGPIHKNRIGLGVMSPLYTIFRFNTKEDAFYEQYFRTFFWHKYMCSVANYGARYDRMNITTFDFMALPLPYPVPEEQEKIVDFLTAIDRKIEAVAQQVNRTEQFKKGLLQKMFV